MELTRKEEQPYYLAYMLRLCRYDTEEVQVWRAYLEDPHSGERFAFANIPALVAFLEEVTGSTKIKCESPSTVH